MYASPVRDLQEIMMITEIMGIIVTCIHDAEHGGLIYYMTAPMPLTVRLVAVIAPSSSPVHEIAYYGRDRGLFLVTLGR